MPNETKQIKFPNGSTIIFYSPKSGLQPKSQSVHYYENGDHTDVFYVSVLDIEALKVFEKFACNRCGGNGTVGQPCPEEKPGCAVYHFKTCPICKGSGSLYREIKGGAE